ncbi:MAG: hypothetical protein V8T36_02070 [Ruthenibacterium lactatiformans]
MLDKTISNLNLNMSYNHLVERVRIQSVNSTQVMKITLKDTDPERARAIAADIVEKAPDTITQTVKAGSEQIISKAKANDDSSFPQQNEKYSTCWYSWCGPFSRHHSAEVLLNNKFMTDDDITNKLGLTVLAHNSSD